MRAWKIIAVSLFFTVVIITKIELETQAAMRTDELRLQNNPCACAR